MRFAALAMLDRIAAQPRAWHAGLLEHPDDHLLEGVFNTMLQNDLVAIGDDDHYQLTAQGQQAHRLMLLQQQAYLIHHDIYAGVDLAEGLFADPEHDNLENGNWDDLRVPVAEFKGIDPYRLVFLAMLADGSFFENEGWRFDIALGSSFFKELQDVVRSQITLDELGFEAEDGTRVPGEAVIEDVILQGAEINLKRMDALDSAQTTLFPEGDNPDEAHGQDENQAEWTVDSENGGGGKSDEKESPDAQALYDPWGTLEASRINPAYRDPIWDASYW